MSRSLAKLRDQALVAINAYSYGGASIDDIFQLPYATITSQTNSKAAASAAGRALNLWKREMYPEPKVERDPGAVRREVNEVKVRIMKNVFAFVMPNGKHLGDCTGAEVRHFGAGFARIAAKVGARQLVRKALTKEQVYSLLVPKR